MMNAFRELFMASFKDMVRERMNLFWFLGFPILFIFLFGTIFSSGGNVKYDVGLAYDSEGPLVHEISAGLGAVPAFTLHTGTLDEELAMLKKGKRRLVVEVPSISLPSIGSPQSIRSLQSTGFLQSGEVGGPIKISVYYDQSHQITSQVLLPVARQVLDEVERRITGRPRVFEVVAEPVQRAKLSDIDFLLPGILAMALMQLGLFGSLRVVSLREQKILKSLGATPLPRGWLIGAEVAIRILMAMVQACAIIAIGQAVFNVNIIGSWFSILGSVFLGAVTFVSMGYMLVSFARTEESGQGIIQLVQFPMMFLSGIFFSVEIMPSFLRPVVTAMPLTYLGDLLRQVMVGAPPIYSISTDLLVLCSWTIVTLVLAARLWKWE
ncbi:MAG TPA: ABC transporter permease [Firmicutes bacterium]|nr:ABC transporter permease [Bacillota bacterium]